MGQAEAELTQQAMRNTDSAHATRLGPEDAQAQAFLREIGAGQTRFDPLTGQTFQLFAADASTRDNHAMFGQYAKASPAVQAALDRAYDAAFKPRGAQTIAGLNGSNAGALTGSDLALNDAARDYSNMRQQPAVVQWSVLGQLRTQRRGNLQAQLQLVQELQGVNELNAAGPGAAQRRGEILGQLTKLQSEDQTLRQASVEQIRVMGTVGLLRPVDQREWVEGAGEAIAASGLLARGVSAASIAGRINFLKSAVEETRAAAEVAKAEAKARVELNARRDDGQQYDQYRTPAANSWDWQKHAPNSGAVPGTKETITVQPGQALDRYGSRYGEYMSPAGTPFEARALPPGKVADPYEQYTVLKPFAVDKEKIAPAFGQPGGGSQLRATIPEVKNGYATVNDLIRHGYLKDPKK